MATKIYLPSSGNPAVTPSTWIFTDQINPLTFAGVTTKISSALTTKLEPTGTVNPTTRAMLRYVWGPLAAQTISGTVRMVMAAFESAAAANANLAMAVKIIQSNGSDRATLLAVTSSDATSSPYELPTSISSRRVWTSSETEPLTLTSQDASLGDYLVIEIGFRSATGTSRNISLRYGDNAASDLTYGDNETNDYNPWVEFSQTINLSSQSVNETASAAKKDYLTTSNQINVIDPVTESKKDYITLDNQVNVIDPVTESKKDYVITISDINVENPLTLTENLGINPTNLLTIEETLYGI